MPSETFNLKKKHILIHPGDGSDIDTSTFLFMDQDNIVLADPTGDNSILIQKDYGIGIQGPLSIQAMPSQIRFAGYWKINPLVLSCLPSTIYTPVPWLMKAPPKQNTAIAKGNAKIIAVLKGLM